MLFSEISKFVKNRGTERDFAISLKLEDVGIGKQGRTLINQIQEITKSKMS